MKNRFSGQTAEKIGLLSRLHRIFPCYAWIPAAAISLYNVFVYYGSRLINRHLPVHILRTPLDDAIPFVPFFILFYILAYLQWGLCYFFSMRENRRLCYETVTVNLIAKTICFVCFLVFPTVMVRPALNGNGLWIRLTRWVYATDIPDNLFPSIHCLESWIAMRALWKVPSVPKPAKLANSLLTLLVCASTVLVKQHFLPDIVAGILVAEIGYLIVRVGHADRLPRLLEPAFVKRASGRTGGTSTDIEDCL